MRHNPPSGAGLASGRDQIRVFSRRFSQRHPAQTYSGGNDAQGEEAGDPDRQGPPAGKLGRAQKRKEDQRQTRQAGAEDGERAETGWRKAELLGSDGVPEAAEVGADEIARGRGLRSAGLAGKTQNVTSDVPAQDDAARLRGLAAANAFPAVASAAR